MREWLTFCSRPRASAAAIRDYQDKRIRRLVRHAWERVPYYRRLMEAAGRHPDRIDGLADLPSIPISRKRDLQLVPKQDLMAAGVNQAHCIEVSTSGSTGEPLLFLRSRWEEVQLYGFRLRAQVLSGLRLTDKRVRMATSPTLWAPHRLGLFPISNLSLDLAPEEMIRRLKLLRPDVIYGRPAMLDLMVRAATGSDLRALRPRLVFCGAELLTSNLRKDFEQAFGCPVVDFYGSSELNLIAWQCRECGQYHTSDDSVVVEVLRDGCPAGPGQEGEVIATALRSFTMPLIRYELGDVVRRPVSPPPCRIGFGVIEQIHGRMADYLPLPQGGFLSPHGLTQALGRLRIRRYQIVQEALDLVIVRFEPLSGSVEEAVRSIEACCRPLVPETIRLEVLAVSQIPVNAAGKSPLVSAYRRPTVEG